MTRAAPDVQAGWVTREQLESTLAEHERDTLQSAARGLRELIGLTAHEQPELGPGLAQAELFLLRLAQLADGAR